MYTNTLNYPQQLQLHQHMISVQQQSMQCFSYAIRSQSVLTTIQLGVSTMLTLQTRPVDVQHSLHVRSTRTRQLPQLAYTISLDMRCYLVIKLASIQSTVDSFAFRSPATAINHEVSKSRHNSTTKLRIRLSHVQKRDNIMFYLRCKFQSLTFSVRSKTEVTDGTRHQRCRCLGGDACILNTGHKHTVTA